MTEKIFKYPLQIEDKQIIEMPEGAEILCVQEQNGIPCLWAFVNPENKTEKRTLYTFGTGHPIENGMSLRYIGTYQHLNGSLVFHVFQQR